MAVLRGYVEFVIYKCWSIYIGIIHWNSFAANKWKWGTIKILVYGVCDIYSNDECLPIELKHIRSSLNKINEYRHWVIFRVFKEIKESTWTNRTLLKKLTKMSLSTHVCCRIYYWFDQWCVCVQTLSDSISRNLTWIKETNDDV